MRRCALALVVTVAGACSGTQAPASPAAPVPADPLVLAPAVSRTGLATVPAEPTPRPAAGPFDYTGLQLIPGDPTDPPPTPTPTRSTTSTPAPGSVPAAPWRFPVLMYHLVDSPVPSPASADLVVSPTLFNAQMKALHDAGWATITVAQLSAALAAGIRPPKQTIAITFDDGHVDGYTNALPILQAYGYLGTFYVVTNRFGWDGYMTTNQVRILAAYGMEIANHTMDHADLARISTANALAQIVGAQDAIQALVGIRPSTLAYPYGDFSSNVIKLVAAAGLGTAVTTVEGCSAGTGNRLTVPRIRVGPRMTVRDLLGALAPCTG